MLKRLTRLFQADFHAVLDQLEDPKALLKQSLREMEAEIAEQEARSQCLRVDLSRIGQQVARCEQALRECETQLDLCFKSDDEGLARSILRRRLEWQRQLEALKERQRQTEDSIAANADRLDHYRQCYQSVQQKAEVMLEENYTACAPCGEGRFSVSEEDVQVAWLAERDRRKRNGDKSRQVTP